MTKREFQLFDKVRVSPQYQPRAVAAGYVIDTLSRGAITPAWCCVCFPDGDEIWVPVLKLEHVNDEA